ncbi:MAG: hypothetical protein EOL87_01270 [Spartobacteria bacterium]|nr:hypothetical protein [Spartobacteria bacterium]
MGGIRALFAVFFCCLLGAGVADAESVRGDMNGWEPSWMAQDIAFGNYWAVSLTNTVDGSCGFIFDQKGNYDPKWGAGTDSQNATANATLGQARIGFGAGNMNSSFTADHVLTFRLGGDSTWWDRPFLVMETTAWPATIATVTNDAETAGLDPVTVTIGLDRMKSFEETVYVRYSVNDWSSSSFVAATGDTSTMTAEIPDQVDGTEVRFYVLSSTFPQQMVEQYTDFCTLRGNNDGSNYFYVVHDPSPAVPDAPAVLPASVTNEFDFTAAWESSTGASEYRVDVSDTNDFMKFVAGYEDVSADSVTTCLVTGLISETTYYYRVRAKKAGGTSGNSFTQCVTTAAHITHLGNCWHIPANYEPQGTFMRNPLIPYADSDVYLYTGNCFQNDETAGDQNGGSVFYRLVGAESWQTAGLGFDSEVDNNKYWKTKIDADTFVATNEVEYYMEVTYENRDTTYIGMDNTLFASATGAQSQPFHFTYAGASGDEPGFIYHGTNVVKTGADGLQFWTKVGYAQGSGTNRWADHVVVYYTTNGTDPVITGLGVAGNADTLVLECVFDHVEEDEFEGGDAMWWQGSVNGLPVDAGSSIRYKVGAWNSEGNNVERFAEYSADPDHLFIVSLYTPGASGLQVSIDGGNSWQNADYTTSKAFIDEINGDSVDIQVHYNPGDDTAKNVEIFSNVGRREYVDVDYSNEHITPDGYADGICPPDGNLLTTNDVGAYFTAFAMTGGPDDYYWTGRVSRCGAYRLTARFQTTEQSGTNWTWYSSDGLRDHAVVVSPKKVHDLTMYELNALTVNAAESSEAGRSTFGSLTDPDNGKFNLNHMDYLQANCLWFQPIHPSADTTRGDPSGYTPGSPYATRDYFAVSKWFGDEGTEDDAMNEFTNFVALCDSYTGTVGTINIMLDGVFNHTAWDAEFGQAGVDLGFCTNKDDRIGGGKPGWYSLWTDYGQPATYYSGVYSNDCATAPDRGDFGKWDDVAELFFGNYAALVRNNPADNANYLNEGDWYDFPGMGTDTKDLWKYFGYYIDYWLEKTGHSGTNSYVNSQDNRGIDGLRCDFGQGLPPQFWEYFINHTRSKKWNFIFMAETLDGGIPGYRSNRHFDVLNEDIVFKFTQAHISETYQFKDAYEDRRNAYNGGSVLLNLTGHDEVMPEDDCWMTASRYGCNAMIDGIPMMFYGQEKGIIPATGEVGGRDQGFALYELNFGKYIVNFKQWNKATFWENPPQYSDGLDQWYGRVNWARLNSPALRSMNRYFLSRKADGNDNPKILATAKYETAGAGPAANDVVLAFALILGDPHTAASDTYDLQGPWNTLGLDVTKYYNVQNLASSDAFVLLWDTPKLGQELYDDGIWVSLDAGTGDDRSITSDGALVQYLRIVEVDAPNHTISVTAGEHGAVSPDGEVTVVDGEDQLFTITAAGRYRIADVCTNGSSIGVAFDNTAVSYEYKWLNVSGDGTLNASFAAMVTTNTPVPVPEEWIHTYYPTNSDYEDVAWCDSDDDTMRAWEEYVAGTDPTQADSMLKSELISVSTDEGHVIRWLGTDQSNRSYSIYFSTNLLNGMQVLQGHIPSLNPAMNSYTDTVNRADATVFYRVRVQLAE